MNYRESTRGQQRSSSSREDDSFVVASSDDEDYNPHSYASKSAARTAIIDDSDSKDDTGGLQSSADESIDSEEEDREFMNKSHRVSIIEKSSESESDEDDWQKNKLSNARKRRSIYDNPISVDTPNKSSTPMQKRQLNKQAKRIVYSDTESDQEPENSENSKSATSSSNNRSKTEESSYSLSNSESADQSFKKNNKSEERFSIKPKEELDMKETKNSMNNVIDLTMNDSMHESSMNEVKDISKVVVDNNDVIVCSSTSTSETEIDRDVVTLAKKEIGVGNIDPIEAQKKELLQINIDHTQQKLDKLRKFAATVDIQKLPDKGAKVHTCIEELESKIMALKEKLKKYSRKTNTPKRFQSPKIVEKPDVKPPVEKTFERSLYENKVDPNRKIDKREGNNGPQFSNQFYEFDVREIPNMPEASFKTDELGKKALETLNKQQSLTHKRLEQLHGSLTSRPTEDQREKDPSGLKIPLMAHQQHALAWMKWRETQKPKGGILADDMGLGKTLTMISLVLATVNNEKSDDSSDSSSSSDEGWMSRKKHKRYYGGTLVVCPASLIRQWEAEVKNRCKRGLLSVLVFHGNNRTTDDRKLSKYNIIITTYQIIVREADAESGMYRMEWNRIILDEAHYVRNHKSKASIAVCGLTSKYRWALTGTPIQNKEMDLYAILKFLKCSPFDDLLVWKRWVDNKNDAGKQRLITIMKGLMLRRTKQELQSKGAVDSLPDKFMELMEIEMDREETLVYQKILLFSQNLFAQFLAQRAEKQHVKELYGGKFDRPSYSSYGSKTQFTKAQKVLLEHHSGIEAHEILVLLLRLRQMCCHPALLHAMLDQEDTEVGGIDDSIDPNINLLSKLQNMSISQEDEGVEDYVANYKIDDRVAANLLTNKNPVFDNERRSSKVRAVIKTVEEVVEKGDKLIIVSQWTSFLEVVAKSLLDIEDAKYAMFTGKVAVKNRQAIIDKFNDPNDDTNILLLSLTAGGVGLNLVGANHLLLIDIHWNPQLESQAQDRIYRFGQKKNVHIYKFICKDTIEERVKNLQDKKLEIANHVLTGSRSVSSKLTIDDLKLLFS